MEKAGFIDTYAHPVEDPGGFQEFYRIPLFKVTVICSYIDRVTHAQECRVL